MAFLNLRPGLAMDQTPCAGTVLTCGDVLFLWQDGFDRPHREARSRDAPGVRAVFDPFEDVSLRMTARADAVRGTEFAGNHVSIDLRGGDDILLLSGSTRPQTICIIGGYGHDLIDATSVFVSPARLDHSLNGGAGDDTVTGADRGLNRINGGSGQDLLTGGRLADSLWGNEGNDQLTAGNGSDRLDGGTGGDLLSAGAGNDTLLGGLGNDTLYGEAGHDRLDGGTESDVLDGGTGNDTLIGGEGRDTLTGGAGRDVFIFATASGRDGITDMTAADRIHLDASFWSGTVEDFVAAKVRTDATGALTLRLTTTDVITLTNTALTAEDLTGLILFV